MRGLVGLPMEAFETLDRKYDGVLADLCSSGCGARWPAVLRRNVAK